MLTYYASILSLWGSIFFFLKINYKILRLLATTFSRSKKQNDICFIYSLIAENTLCIFLFQLYLQSDEEGEGQDEEEAEEVEEASPSRTKLWSKASPSKHS